MGWLKLVLWSGACVGLGVASATWRPGGKTLVERAAAGWAASAPLRARLEDGSVDLLEAARRRLFPDDAPSEHHSPAERAAVRQLIERRGSSESRR